jgi:hypothetical protein
MWLHVSVSREVVEISQNFRILTVLTHYITARYNEIFLLSRTPCSNPTSFTLTHSDWEIYIPQTRLLVSRTGLGSIWTASILNNLVKYCQCQNTASILTYTTTLAVICICLARVGGSVWFKSIPLDSFLKIGCLSWRLGVSQKSPKC